MSMYSFKRLINKYSGMVIVHKEAVGDGYWNDDGEWVPSTGPAIEERLCAVIPYDMKTISQMGGQVKQSDRQIYSLTPFNHGDKVEHQGMKYKVDTSVDFTQFGDFYRYHAQGVSSFDQVNGN